MNAAAASVLLKHLRRQVDLISHKADGGAMARQAEGMVQGLTADERDLAATFYVIHLLKERHRGKVLTNERAATRPRVRYEDTLAPDDPYFAQKAAAEARGLARIQSILTDYADAMKVEWTRDLLASTFALPDGRLVAWGDATVEDHEARRDMLVRNAEGNIEAAARHTQAIDDLRAASAPTLADLAKQPAA